METTVKERLISFIKTKGISTREFQEQCGLSNAYVANLKRAPTADKIEKILRSFPELNVNWLLKGEGEMLNSAADERPYSIENSNYTLVPLINIDSVGGMSNGNIITSGEQYTERLVPFTEARDGDVAIYQSGDSMNPGIPSGSILLIRHVPDWREYFGYGDVFVLWLKDDRRLTKQIKKYSPDPSNYITCHSFNPDYGDEELPKKYIREVWKVIKVLADKGW